MDLSTRYLGLDLAHPFVPGASPLADDIGMVLRLQDGGAPAIVMSSLFEEDVVQCRGVPDRYLEQSAPDQAAVRGCRSSRRSTV